MVPSYGVGCWQARARKDRYKLLEDMRCCDCAVIRDAEKARTQAKGAGKGQSSTGSDSAAGTARREDEARFVQLNIEISNLIDRIQRQQLAIEDLQDQVRRLHAILEKWNQWC